MGDVTYYLQVDETQRGPFTLEELISQPVQSLTPVRQEGAECWVHAEDIPAIKSILEERPPPLPPELLPVQATNRTATRSTASANAPYRTWPSVMFPHPHNDAIDVLFVFIGGLTVGSAFVIYHLNYYGWTELWHKCFIAVSYFAIGAWSGHAAYLFLRKLVRLAKWLKAL